MMVRIANCAALLLLFLWPAIYSGQPLFSPDTGAYIRGFDAGVVWLSGRTTVWTTWASKLRAPQEAADDSTAEQVKSFQSPAFILAGRSVSYGALLYLGELLGGLWASIAIQAAAALAAVSLTLRHLKLFSWPKLVLTAVTLGLASSLPFFTSFLLPDVFAGLALLAAANLLALGHRLTRWEQVFLDFNLGRSGGVPPVSSRNRGGAFSRSDHCTTFEHKNFACWHSGSHPRSRNRVRKRNGFCPRR